MAVKAKTGEEMIREAVEMAQEQMQEDNPWNVMKEIYVPKRTRGEQNTVRVLVNSQSYMVPLDQRTQVPLPVYEVLIESMEQRKQMEINAEEGFGGSAFPVAK